MRKLSLFVCAILPFLVLAQTTPQEVYANLNKAGGVYYAYPVDNVQNETPPAGYEPFYISHYGRHGSRYLIGDNDYKWVLDFMRTAHADKALTDLGEDVLQRIEKVWVEAYGRGGDLSPLGVRQHRGIAERMFTAYPQVFDGAVDISARSTIVMRCAMSMDAFCERLKELNPKLNITREASNRYMNYLNYHSPESNKFTAPDAAWRKDYNEFEKSHTHPDRLMASLFTNAEYIKGKSTPHKLMWGFYWLAVDMQNMETKVTFNDIFEPKELFDLWQAFNYRFYVCDSNYAGNKGMMLDNAKPLLSNIINSADEVIAHGGHGATLRFGHDGNLIPLAGVLRLKDCYNSVSDANEFYKNFADFKISPMAGNIQIVFFRNNKNTKDVLVKFMLNERETSIPVKTDKYPFYNWQDVKAYYTKIISEEK